MIYKDTVIRTLLMKYNYYYIIVRSSVLKMYFARKRVLRGQIFDSIIASGNSSQYMKRKQETRFSIDSV